MRKDIHINSYHNLIFSIVIFLTLQNVLVKYMFQGLQNGDKWCLCVLRWKEAYEAGYAPKVDLESTNEKALNYVSINDLIKHAYKKKNIDL